MLHNVPAPLGGLNHQAPVSALQAHEAVEMINWLPEDGRLRVRPGMQTRARIIGASHTYPFGDKLVVASATDLYTFPSSGITDEDWTETSIGTGYSTEHWDSEIINEKLLLVNGQDAPLEYDGTTLTSITFTGVSSPEDFIGVMEFKGRAVYWKGADLGFYYAAAGSYAGALTYFDLSSLAGQGESIVHIFPWSIDAGDGIDDVFVVVFNTGNIVVYQGSDPSDAADWHLVSTLKGPAVVPSGSTYESMTKPARVAGDAVYLSNAGVVSFGHIMNGGDVRGGIGAKVNDVISKRMVDGVTPEESVVYLQTLGILVVQVKQSYYERLIYALNINSMAWTSFNPGGVLNIHDFSEWQGNAVFSGEGHVGMLSQDYDRDRNDILFPSGLLAYTYIIAYCTPAWSYFGARHIQKQLTALKITTTADDPSDVDILSCSDFVAPNDFFPPAVPITSEGSPAGQWRNITAFGYAISFRMRVACYTPIDWISTTYKVVPAEGI